MSSGRDSVSYVLENHSYFTFLESHEVIERSFTSQRLEHLYETELVNTRDWFYLAAAEFALTDLFIYPPSWQLPLTEAIVVSEGNAKLATMAFNCCPFDPQCASPTSLDDMHFWELSVFSGFTSKLSRVAQTNSLMEVVDDFNSYVALIERGYANSTVEGSELIAKSGLIRLQGLLWRSRIAMVRGEDPYETVTSYSREMLEEDRWAFP